jgi:hypothetical protein
MNRNLVFTIVGAVVLIAALRLGVSLWRSNYVKVE